MVELPQVQIIACHAAHDETAGVAKNFSLPFCRSNAICTHGNKAIDAAIDRGVASSKIKASEAESMRQLLSDTRIELARWADRISVWRKLIRQGTLSPHDTQSLESSLVVELGEDRSKWDEVHRNRQLEIAQPIVEIVQQLKELGLLVCSGGVQYVNARKLIEDSYLGT